MSKRCEHPTKALRIIAAAVPRGQVVWCKACGSIATLGAEGEAERPRVHPVPDYAVKDIPPRGAWLHRKVA